MERSQKFGSLLTSKVNVVQEAGDKHMEKNNKVEQSFIKEIRELSAEVAAVKEKIWVPPQVQNPPSQQPMIQPQQCRSCQQNGNGWFCDHCFRCGILAIMFACALHNSVDVPIDFQGNCQRSCARDRV